MTNKNLNLFEMIKSVVMSFLGVQKDSVRQRDFKKGNARQFVMVAVAMTLLFIFLLYGVVQFILYSAGLN